MAGKKPKLYKGKTRSGKATTQPEVGKATTSLGKLRRLVYKAVHNNYGGSAAAFVRAAGEDDDKTRNFLSAQLSKFNINGYWDDRPGPKKGDLQGSKRRKNVIDAVNAVKWPPTSRKVQEYVFTHHGVVIPQHRILSYIKDVLKSGQRNPIIKPLPIDCDEADDADDDIDSHTTCDE